MPNKKADADFTAGRKAYAEKIIMLRKHWPKAFPEDNKRVRPLEMKALHIIAEKMEWTPRYTRGVLHPWKQRAAYCNAVLKFEKRIYLNGKESDEIVGDKARSDAQKTLDQIKQRREARQQLAVAAA